MLRFTAPAEVKGVALLIVNHPDRASDQWMWRPTIGRDQRIALQDRSTRFFGTDFSFEDLEERDVDQYDFKLLGEENGTVENRIAAAQIVAIHVLVFVGEERQLHLRQGRGVQQKGPGARDRLSRFRAGEGHLDRAHSRRCSTWRARAGRLSSSTSSNTICR